MASIFALKVKGEGEIRRPKNNTIINNNHATYTWHVKSRQI